MAKMKRLRNPVKVAAQLQDSGLVYGPLNGVFNQFYLIVSAQKCSSSFAVTQEYYEHVCVVCMCMCSCLFLTVCPCIGYAQLNPAHPTTLHKSWTNFVVVVSHLSPGHRAVIPAKKISLNIRDIQNISAAQGLIT